MPTNLPTTKKAEAFARRLATAQVKAKGSHSHIDLEASGKAVAELAFTDEVKRDASCSATFHVTSFHGAS